MKTIYMVGVTTVLDELDVPITETWPEADHGFFLTLAGAEAKVEELNTVAGRYEYEAAVETRRKDHQQRREFFDLTSRRNEALTAAGIDPLPLPADPGAFTPPTFEQFNSFRRMKKYSVIPVTVADGAANENAVDKLIDRVHDAAIGAFTDNKVFDGHPAKNTIYGEMASEITRATRRAFKNIDVRRRPRTRVE